MNHKKYNYIAVIQDGKTKLVTGWDTKKCYWFDSEKPKAMTQSLALDFVYGLCLNGYKAYMLVSLWEIDEQF